MKYTYVRRIKDGQTFDVPDADLEETLKRGGFELVEEVKIVSTPPVVIDKTNITVDKIVCPLCDKEFKSEHGLKIHKSSHK